MAKGGTLEDIAGNNVYAQGRKDEPNSPQGRRKVEKKGIPNT